MTRPSKARIRQSFERAAPTYDSAADIQRRICHRLIDMLPDVSAARLLDAGCGTGYALPLLRQRFPEAQPIGLDLSPAMLRHVAEPCCRVAADLEHLPLADASIDLFWSSLAVQWCDLPLVLSEARRILRPGGTLALASLGPATFHELRRAFAGVDEYRHTLGFHNTSEVQRMAAEAGFPALDVRSGTKMAHYADFKSLLRSVKATGADTEIGKTFITCALLHRARLNGLRAAGLKPVAAGTDSSGLNDDVEAIRGASNVELPRAITNAYCFKPAIAPHIAAAEEKVCIDLETINAACDQARQQADMIIVEGVGGFCVPLGAGCSTADLAVKLDLPVILVVGMRLGCINHALLTVEAIASRGLTLAGWVANRIDPAMARFEENRNTLERLLPAPRLGSVPNGPEGGAAGAARYLRLPGA